MSKYTRGIRFVLSIWKQQKAEFYCVSTKRKDKPPKDHFFTRETFDEIEDTLEDHEDEDIYFCPRGFSRRARQQEEGVPCKLIWADCDEANPKKMREMKLTPTWLWESSPGRYAGVWLLDENPPDTLRKRLSYQIGADRGGWDATQLLRFPGTTNYKYDSRPKVRIIHSRGDDDSVEYERGQIERRCADLDEEDAESGRSARDILHAHRKRIKPSTRRALLQTNVTAGTDRSAVIWKAIKELVEAGLDEDEVLIVMSSTALCKSKYQGRNMEKQLRNQITKAMAEKFGTPTVQERHRDTDPDEPEEDDDDENPYTINPQPLSGVQRETINWLWDRRIAIGSLTIIEGPPGLGKSFVTHMVTGCVIDGARIKSDRPTGFKPQKGKVLMLDMENDAATVVRPRLEDNGFENLDAVSVVRKVIPLDEDDAIDALSVVIKQYKPILVVFDTLSYFLGRASENSTSDMSQLFERVARIAKENQVAIVLLRHWRKGYGDGVSATDKGAGSIAIAGSARCVLAVSKTGDPDLEEEGWRAVSVAKINVGSKAKALLYRIKDGKKNEGSLFEWGDTYDVDSDEIVNRLSKGPAKGGKEDRAAEDAKKAKQDAVRGAEAFLRRKLADNAIYTEARIRRIAEMKGIDGVTLREVADKIGVEINKHGEWRLRPISKKD